MSDTHSHIKLDTVALIKAYRSLEETDSRISMTDLRSAFEVYLREAAENKRFIELMLASDRAGDLR